MARRQHTYEERAALHILRHAYEHLMFPNGYQPTRADLAAAEIPAEKMKEIYRQTEAA